MKINKHKNQNGLTLIELLAALVLTSLIIILATSILVKGMENYKLISTENEIRDEADLIMAKLYREIYTNRHSEINAYKQENKLSDGTYRDSYILYNEKTLDDGTKVSRRTGFINEKLYIEEEEYLFQNPNIKLNSNTQKSSIIETSEGVYQIKLVLYMENKNKSLEFVNEISIINDKKEEKNEGI